MAIILVKTISTEGKGIRKYIVETTDLESTYPTDCEAGSSMHIIDKTAKKVVGFKEYDGTQWNEV